MGWDRMGWDRMGWDRIGRGLLTGGSLSNIYRQHKKGVALRTLHFHLSDKL